MSICDGAVPDIMVTFAVTLKNTIILSEYFTYFFFVFGHYSAILSLRSDKKVRVRGDTRELFNARSSGTARRTRFNRSSNESDSNMSPGMSWLVAIQTLASLSQVKFMMYSIIRHLQIRIVVGY